MFTASASPASISPRLTSPVLVLASQAKTGFFFWACGAEAVFWAVADWAILKHNGQALYLVRETKGTRDFLKLRTSEADKVRCGQKHFEALGVPFAVAVTADEV